MRCAIYVRVSTDEQASQGFSLDSQKERLVAFCVSQGWNDYKLYMDDGYTGTNLDRPALKRMVKHIKEKKIDAVIVYKLDRLSRRQADVLYMLEDVFEKNGVIFKSATEPFDTGTPLGKAMIGILAVFAQLERDMIIERATAGRRQRISQGKWSGGRIPFGYNWNPETERLEINEEQARIVREMFKMYLRGKSRLEIAEWAEKRTSEREFCHTTVREILSRILYTGKLQNKEMLVEGNHEAIIDMELFEAVQREFNRRREARHRRSEFLLTGFMQCGVCGDGIVHVRRRKKNSKTEYYNYYACKNQHVQYKEREDGKKCSLGYHHRQLVELQVIQEIKKIGLSPDKMTIYLDESEEASDHESLIAELNEKLKKTLFALENLYQAIEEGVKASFVSGRISKLEEERERIETQLEDLEIESPRFKSRDKLVKMIKMIGEAWDHMTFEEQREMLQKIVSRVILDKHGKVTIRWNINE